MRYNDIKIVEKDTQTGVDKAGIRWGQQNKGVETKTDFQKMARSLSRWYDKECKLERHKRKGTARINAIMTGWRRQSVKYGDKNYLKNLAAALNATGHTVLANLIAKSVIPPGGNLVINPNGSTSPEYTKDMCPGGGGDKIGGPGGNKTGGGSIGGGDKTGGGNKTGGGDYSTIVIDKGNDGKGTSNSGIPGYTPPSDKTDKDGSGGQTVGDKFGTETQTLQKFISDKDYQGAIEFIDSNPEFGKESNVKQFRTDLQSWIDADEAEERNRIASEKAIKKAKRVADEKAAQKLKDEAAAAAEAERIAAEEKQKRLDTIELKRKAEEAEQIKKEKLADDLRKKAEAKKAEADRIEKDRIAAEEEVERIRRETEKNKIKVKPEPKDKPVEKGDVKEYDWEELG